MKGRTKKQKGKRPREGGKETEGRRKKEGRVEEKKGED